MRIPQARTIYRSLGAGLASLLLLAGSTVVASAQTAAPPPPLKPVIECPTDPGGGTMCTTQAAQWVTPSVAALHVVVPAGLPRAGDGSMVGHAEAP